MKKRVLSLILAAVMVCAVLPTAALAAERTVTEVIPCKYDEVRNFSEGLAAVKLDGQWGYIDQMGKEVTPYRYKYASDFSEGLARVRNDIDRLGFVDRIGKEVVPFGKYDAAKDFSEGLAAVRVGNSSYFGKWGFIDTTGQEVIPCKYDSAWGFSDGLAMVTLDGKYGYIDTTGKEVIPCKYDDTWGFSEGFARVKLDGKYGFIDATGKEVIPCKYDSAVGFSEGLAAVERSIGRDEVGRRQLRLGFIDKTGKEVIPCKYYHVLHSFHEGLAVVMVPDGTEDGTHYKYGVIDKTGKEVVPFKYRGIGNFSEGFAKVFSKDTLRYGFIDTTGKEILAPTKYWNMTDFSGGLAKVGVKVRVTGEVDDLMPDEWEWGYVNTAGEEIVPIGKYSDLSEKASEGLFKVWSSGVGYGMVDVTGEEVVPCKYDGMSDFSEGLAAVALGRKWGFISLDPNAVAYTPDVESDPGETTAPTVTSASANTAHPSTQTVDVDGTKVVFQCYALKDENGNDTNYIKLRDLADILNGSAAQFQVGWDGNITITTKTAYTKNGTEQNTPFSGQRTYEKTAVKTLVDGKETSLDTFQLKDDAGGGYTYYKLRDLGKALGITVDWSGERGIFIETK